ncbi:MAG: glycine cleavage system protein GcvH [Thermoplasmata archaeon]|nr:glycine cleavage system protein GcvH [Thermoplasmata archaeon]
MGGRILTDSNVPEGLRYAKSHEWVRLEGDVATIGITDHAQAELTDIVFVDAPAVGTTVVRGGILLVLESVKTVADIYAPADGTVAEPNGELRAHPEWVNQDPYGKGWLVRLRITGPLDPALLDAAGYRAFLAGTG